MSAGDLFYHLNDPTGASLALADETGAAAGHMVYDGYGGVLSNTLPLTLSGTLADAPDAATGLVHQGGGRYYDPTLGRPLQPNPAGGPTAAPQALNRYAATPAGQPGVYQGAASAGSISFDQPEHRLATTAAEASFSAIALRDTVAQTALGYAAEKAIGRTAAGPLTVIISKSSWYRHIGRAELGLRPLFRKPSVARPQFGKTFRAYTTLDDVVSQGNGRYLAETGELIDTTNLPASARVQFMPRWSPAVRHLAGAGFAFGLSATFQLAEDWNNPYLTFEQRAFRTGVSGTGGLVSWYVGLGATEIAAGAGAGAWAGPIGLVIGGGVTFVWVKWIQPSIFNTTDTNPQRNLMPLN